MVEILEAVAEALPARLAVTSLGTARALVIHYLAEARPVRMQEAVKVLAQLADPLGPEEMVLLLLEPLGLRLQLHSPTTGRTRFLTI